MFQVRDFLLKIKRFYWIGLTVIIFLLSASFFTLSQFIKTQESHGTLINVAGKQRMLSQKIALYSGYYVNIIHMRNEREKTALIIKNAAQEMQKNHRYLYQNNNPITLAIHELFEGDVGLNHRVKKFTNSANNLIQQASSDNASQILETAFSPAQVSFLLSSLDNVVSAMEIASKHNVKSSLLGIIVLWIITLFVLIAFVYFSVAYVVQTIISHYRDTNKKQRKIEDFQSAMNKHAVVYRVNLDDCIVSVNDKFTQLYGYQANDIIGQSQLRLMTKTHSPEIYREMKRTLAKGKTWQYDFCNQDSKGNKYWLSTTVVPSKNYDGKANGYMVIQNDVSEQKQISRTLSQLHHITSEQNQHIEDKISQLLVMGCQLFKLPFAILSKVDGDTYEVLHAKSPNNEMAKGAKFPLGNTYCTLTLNAKKPKAYHNIGQSKLQTHPCYVEFGLKSYIGAPIIVAGKAFGTLNFSSPEARLQPFSENDIELIQLIAQWLGYELTRTQQQEELLAQQRLMEKISEQARIGAWEVNMQTHEVLWSAMTKEIHEVSPQYKPNIEQGIEFYKAGDNRDLIRSLVDKAINYGESFEAEFELITALGNHVWVKSHGTPVMENGVCVRLFGSFQDISEKKKAEQLIIEKSQRIDLAADSAGIGVWEYNIQTGELSWDDWMFRLYSMKKADFTHTYNAWSNSLHPDDKDQAMDEIELAIAGKQKFDTQFRVLHPNGVTRYIKADALVLYDADDTPRTMIGVNYDITSRVKNEIEITEAKLAAEEATKAKSEFLASMSHEIRTPMNGVVGMLDLLNDSSLNEEQKHQVKIAKSSADSLLFLINDILDFSKIDANKLELEEIPFDIKILVADFFDAIVQQAERKGLELMVDTSQLSESLIVGDPNRIRQILTNLVSNAIKFTDSGEVIIKLALKPFSQEKWRLLICVKDTGIGIPKDKQHHLFQSFSQVDASTTRQYGGTGLGLAIVRKLCRRMQGDIEVVSDIGEGCTFNCDLHVGKTSQHLPGLPDADITQLNVLVVDDNEAHRTALKKQLERWLVSVTTVTNAQDAITECEHAYNSNTLYDVIILDMNMPKLSGEQLGKALRKDDRFKSIKLVMITSLSNKGDAQRFASGGFDAYFAKPISTTDLSATLHILADNKQALASAQPLITKHYIKTIKQQKPEQAVNTETTNDLPNFVDNTLILLVEDNRVNQMVAKGLLAKLSLPCNIANNGVEALAKLKENKKPYSLILMDCQMPEMDGYEATQKIRAGDCGEMNQNIPIVAMTANAMEGDREKCLAAGMDDYLSKPVDKNLLIDKLKMYLPH